MTFCKREKYTASQKVDGCQVLEGREDEEAGTEGF
jgi:hypothetical protein